jgi:tetratricopeptide (TPR) repeat protein
VSNKGADRANEMSGMAKAVVQAGSVAGGIHLHQAPSVPVAIPHELPGDVTSFTDRVEQLAQMDLLLASVEGSSSAAAVVISTILGTAGVGKTAFVTHWAHRVSARFPDGQLYVNLHGFDRKDPVLPTEALAGFLRSLGVPNADIPIDVDERAARFRSLVAGRRILIVLDNARSAEQIRPLLPGTSSCLVLVTSRNMLSGLVSRDGARRVNLDLLPRAQALQLLRELIGKERVDAEREAAEGLVEHCSRLPLALRIAGELARAYQTLAGLVEDLADEQDRLETLDAIEDPITAIRGVLSWSYRSLAPDQATAFRLLGLHPGRSFENASAAVLVESRPQRARRVIRSLIDAHLVEELRGERYQMHDLLRIYAAGLAQNEEPAQPREAALRRLFDFFLSNASVAMDMLYPQETDRRPRVPIMSDSLVPMAGKDEAIRWLDSERSALLGMAAYTSHSTWAIYTTALSTTLYRYLDSHGHFQDAVTLHTAAVAAARQRDEPVAVGRALQILGSAYQRLGRYEEAVTHLGQALEVTRQVGQPMVEAFALSDLGLVLTLLGRHNEALERSAEALRLFRQEQDQTGQGQVLNNMGLVFLRQQRYVEAVDHIHQALALFREDSDLPRIGYALNDMGCALRGLARYNEALDHHTEALAVARETTDRALEAAALNGLGNAHREDEVTESVLELHEQAYVIAQSIGDRYEQAQAQEGLARAHVGLGRRDHALSHWRIAHTIYVDLGSPEADEASRQLAELSD